MRRFSVILVIQRLEWNTCVVARAGGNLCITRMGAKLMVMSHNEAFERRSPMHDARLAHRCKGEGAQRDIATEIAP
jgi:hypothetical protein